MRLKHTRLALASTLAFGLVATSGSANPVDFDALAKLPPQERIEKLQTEIDAGESTKQMFFHLGNAHYEAGNPHAASLAFAKAVEIDPQYFKAMVNLALMYDEERKYPMAIETFERAAEIEPGNADVWSHMGNTYYAQRKYAEAMDLYRKSLEINPDSPHALYSMGVAFADAGIFREAVAYWGRVSELEKESELGRSAAENVELLQKYLIPQQN